MSEGERGAIVETAAGLRALLPSGGALIGLDLGTKTIGTAFCDAGWSFATPATTIKRRKFLADRVLAVSLEPTGSDKVPPALRARRGRAKVRVLCT